MGTILEFGVLAENNPFTVCFIVLCIITLFIYNKNKKSLKGGNCLVFCLIISCVVISIYITAYITALGYFIYNEISRESPEARDQRIYNAMNTQPVPTPTPIPTPIPYEISFEEIDNAFSNHQYERVNGERTSLQNIEFKSSFKNSWDFHYKGKLVKWKGKIVDVEKTSIEIIMKDEFINCVYLYLNLEYNYGLINLKKGQTIQFTGVLDEYSDEHIGRGFDLKLIKGQVIY